MKNKTFWSNITLVIENLHDNLNSTCKTLINYSNLKIKCTLLLLLGAFQFSPTIDYIPFILDYGEEYFDNPQLSKCYCNVFIIF
jgi:hypothetical protein